jgi:hypothetical protein
MGACAQPARATAIRLAANNAVERMLVGLIERIFKVISSISKIMDTARLIALFNHNLGAKEFFDCQVKSIANPAAYP